MGSVFEKRAGMQPSIIDTTKPNSKISPFQERAKTANPESFLKSSARTALQIPQGLAEGSPYGIATGLWQAVGTGESLDPLEIERLKEISEREGVPFDEEKYLNAVQDASNTIPTVSNIASQVEKRTGAPLEAKNRLQKGLRFASTATKVVPSNTAIRPFKTALPKPVLGGAVAGTNEVLKELGLPEPLSEIVSFGILQPSTGASKLSVGASKKPSGLTNQRYEKLKKPTEVSKGTIDKINRRTEAEFRDITDKIIKDSPIKDTYANLKNDARFKQETSDAFQDVTKIAESLPEKFQTKALKNKLVVNATSKNKKGITPSEFDKKHKSFIDEFIKDTPEGEITAADWVSQYRKNNKSLSEVFEPGQSFAHNNAKREALLDYNKTIADMIDNYYPNSEFSNLFKETNKKWSEISDAESINKFLDAMFDGEIKYQKGRQFFDKAGMTVPFKRAMGEEGFNKFSTLMNDLMSTEQANKLLKQAKSKGFEDLAKTGISYLIHPELGYAKAGYDAIKGGYKQLFEMLLDKPQLAVTWDRGINAMKAGNFKAAENEFEKIKASKAQFDISEKTRLDSLKKFNESKLQSKKT